MSGRRRKNCELLYEHARESRSSFCILGKAQRCLFMTHEFHFAQLKLKLFLNPLAPSLGDAEPQTLVPLGGAGNFGPT